jgi:uncharacterized protein YjbI with pentapeptide repeats
LKNSIITCILRKRWETKANGKSGASGNLSARVEVWNQWRKEHRDIRPDLSGIDFTSAHLNDVRLSFSQLKEACFRNAQLQRAYFVSSDLSDADFRNALLTNAHLMGQKSKRPNFGVKIMARNGL